MPSELSREQVAAIAALANLQLDDAETDLFAQQLGAILAYAEEIQQADTTGVPPTSAVVTKQAADRADEIVASLPIDAVLANAPESERTTDAERAGGFFKVPQVIG